MAPRKLLGRDEILAADDLQSVTIDVPEWGGRVRLRTITAAERDAWDEVDLKRRLAQEPVSTPVRARLVALCAVDGNGQQLFSTKDVEALAAKSAKAMDRVFGAASDLNFLSAGSIGELEKN
jgi:hypothetical protein